METEFKGAGVEIDADLRCPHCDYDLRGLPTNRCPECGREFDVEELKEATRSTDLISTSGLVALTLFAPVIVWIGRVFIQFKPEIGVLIFFGTPGYLLIAMAASYVIACRPPLFIIALIRRMDSDFRPGRYVKSLAALVLIVQVFAGIGGSLLIVSIISRLFGPLMMDE